MRVFATLLWCVVAISARQLRVEAQGFPPPAAPVVVMVPERLNSMLRRSPPPVYPAIANAAQVKMLVMLRVRFTEVGRVASAEVVRGHPMLDQASFDALRAWQVEPAIENGQPVLVESWVVFSFGRGGASKEQIDAIGAADEALLQCGLAADGPTPASAVQTCAKARLLAEALIQDLRIPFEQRARLGHGKALISAAMSKDAIEVLEPVTKKPTPWFYTETALAMRLMAQAQAALGQFEDAAKTCGKARNEYTLGRSNVVSGTPLWAERTALLKAASLECADILEKSGKPKDAEDARKRALALK